MGSPISFSTSCSRISTNSRFANTASHSLLDSPARISLCMWPSPSEEDLKEDLKPAEEDFFTINGSLRSVSCQISQETVSQRKGVRRKDALKRQLQTTLNCRDGLTDSLITHLLGRENGRVLPRLLSYNAGPKG